MKDTIIKRLNNIPLKQKILAIVLIGVSVVAAASFTAVHILSGSYNKLLYQTLSESMEYSSGEIVEYMQKMENLTTMFLAEERCRLI